MILTKNEFINILQTYFDTDHSKILLNVVQNKLAFKDFIKIINNFYINHRDNCPSEYMSKYDLGITYFDDFISGFPSLIPTAADYQNIHYLLSDESCAFGRVFMSMDYLIRIMDLFVYKSKAHCFNFKTEVNKFGWCSAFFVEHVIKELFYYCEDYKHCEQNSKYKLPFDEFYQVYILAEIACFIQATNFDIVYSKLRLAIQNPETKEKLIKYMKTIGSVPELKEFSLFLTADFVELL